MKQQGSSALMMVMMVLLMGAGTLHFSRLLLEQGMSTVVDDRQRIAAFWQAQSALAWAEHLTWPQSVGWVCQQDTTAGWQSCLRSVKDQRFLLQGRGVDSELQLWRWVSWQQGKISRLPHGWIDFCPLSQGCEPDAQ
ncbi:DUF2509 family protein [Candidatus Pantoea multigeneris]|uniref:DUF2509 family protein n=1 Tax=Candidatus Pantoea multigeneris TaxID=2608357 RepID=A0ABX0RCY9_9GAMM|nr:DUF2509 family protein [Pantoea multigeneris]